MNSQMTLSEIAAESGGIISNKAAEAHGISRAVLSNLSQTGVLQRVSRGQYVFPNTTPDALLSVSMRAPGLILSHETALWLHGLSDQAPSVHTMTAPSGKMPSKALLEDCRVYYIKPELFELGKVSLFTPCGNTVTAYDLERTLCDCVRSRNKMCKDSFRHALKMYAKRTDKDLNRLLDYAEKFRISGVLQKYLEVLL